MSKWQYPILRDNLSINIIGHTVRNFDFFREKRDEKFRRGNFIGTEGRNLH